MISFRKKSKKPDKDKTKKPGMISRLKDKLSKTGGQIFGGLGDIFKGKNKVDEGVYEELENRLLMADVGVDLTQRIIDRLRQNMKTQQTQEPQAVLSDLKNQLLEFIQPYEQTLAARDHRPYVICAVGVNGSGKTTTLAKLAYHYKQQGYRVLLAAGDTFRAAAIEQLQRWGEAYDIPVVAQSSGSDSAAVIYDAVQAAQSRGYDIVLADTAGRLHTQQSLMDELRKVMKVIAKLDASAPHATLLVLDAGIGQNAINQAEQFKAAVKVNGLAITKLDGTAKGGVLFALAEKTGLPVNLIGVGESVDDLQPFDAKAFVDALFSQSDVTDT